MLLSSVAAAAGAAARAASWGGERVVEPDVAAMAITPITSCFVPIPIARILRLMRVSQLLLVLALAPVVGACGPNDDDGNGDGGNGDGGGSGDDGGGGNGDAVDEQCGQLNAAVRDFKADHPDFEGAI